MANTSTPLTASAQNFETAIERLEGIVEAMESEKLPLEELLIRYEEGIKLVKVCQEKLEAAEKRIEIITRNAAGKAEVEEFEPSAAAPASAPAKVKKPDTSADVSLF